MQRTVRSLSVVVEGSGEKIHSNRPPQSQELFSGALSTVKLFGINRLLFVGRRCEIMSALDGRYLKYVDEIKINYKLTKDR